MSPPISGLGRAEDCHDFSVQCSTSIDERRALLTLPFGLSPNSPVNFRKDLQASKCIDKEKAPPPPPPL